MKNIFVYFFCFLFCFIQNSWSDDFIINNIVINKPWIKSIHSGQKVTSGYLEIINIIKFISKILILYGMISLGLQTNLNQIFTLGYKPFIVGFIACISVGLLTIFYLKILF